MKLQMEELVQFLQEALSKDFFFDDDFVIEQLQSSMAELKRAKMDVPVAGKEDEFPKKLGKIPADSQPAMLNLTHLVNGQKNNSVPKARASQGTREGRQEGSPRRYGEGGQESSPTRPTLRHQQKPVTLNTQSGLPKNDGENPRRKPEGQAEADPKQKHNATANQNSNAVLTTGKEFVPRWIKPSDVKIIEKTTKITMEFKTRSPKQSWTGTGPAPEDEAQLFNLKQKVRVWDVDESKRGSNASQYDNVPEADLENGNLMEQVPERVFVPSPRSTAFSSGSRKEIEKGSSPPKISNSYAFSSQPRVLRYSSQSDGSVVGPHMRQPPPSYNNPPVYQGYSPKHVTKVGNFTATQYNHGTRTSSPPRNYSVLHQNLVVTPSSRIEVLPDEVFPSSPRGLRPAIPPVDYLPDHKKWPDPPFVYQPGAYGQSWGGDGGQSHFSNLKRHPAFQAKPLEDPSLPTLSVDRPLRYRTASGELGPPSYQYPSSPGPDRHYRHQADGLSMNESVLL
uniref:USP6 N-terminal-like protein n=1 Tax=Naja naja TaxID=35670 RepID=A0A8C6X557_NAJNA